MWQLPASDWPTAADAWWTLLRVDWIIRHRSYAAWRHWLDSLDPGVGVRADLVVARRVIGLMERVARHHVGPMNCLRRSLAAKLMLERRGIPCCLHLGVRRDTLGIIAHAWLSDGHGTLLNDTPEVVERYQELTRDQWAATFAHSEFDQPV